MLALTGPARRWEPKRLRLRLLSAAGRIVRGSRRQSETMTRPPPHATNRRSRKLEASAWRGAAYRSTLGHAWR
jgi:hypothetical protein